MNAQGPSFGSVDLTNCDREPIRIPGSIQPHGLLIAIDPRSMNVVQIAGDTLHFLGQAQEKLLGRSLNVSAGTGALQRIEMLIRMQQILPRPFFIMEATFGERQFDISAHLSGDLVILELEYCTKTEFDAITSVQAMTARTNSVETLPALLNLVAIEVQAATGFDRVMVYRFREDDSGEVVAEHRRSESVDSFLGLHYPASDIPVQARELYCNNWIRFIPDISYTPERLNPPLNPLSGGPLDLSFSALRSVSPVHLEYLANMGIAASMSLSIVIGGKLWGLIACHHSAPVSLGSRPRAALELFAQVLSLQIHARLDLARSAARIGARDIQAQLMSAMRIEGLSVLLRGRPNVLDLIPVGGAALVVDGEVTIVGVTPEIDDIAAMVEWLNLSLVDGIFSTDCLSECYAPAVECVGPGAGLLAISISPTPRDYVLWFLPELVGTVTWAGDPKKPLAHGPLGDRLTPRKSFSTWIETVQAHARPWTPLELESATVLRIAILDTIVLQLNHIARERERRAKDHMDLLMSELDHRVKNTLATIQAVVRFSGRHADNIVDYARSLERRIASMAKSHSLLTLGRWKGAPLRKLIEDELSSHRPIGHGSVRLLGEDVDLDPKAAMAVGLVLHELATNAVKHGCLSVEDGTVSILWTQVARDAREWLRIEWRETGGPPVKPPTRSGFGRTLLERVFAQDVQGQASLEFLAEGLHCVLEIPRSHIMGREETSVPHPSLMTAVPLAAPAKFSTPLKGLAVLVVEDGALIALELAQTLVSYGGHIVGPCSQIDSALTLAKGEMIDVALLDIDLNGEPVWPVAEVLKRRGIPFIFVTGFTDTTRRPAQFRNAPTINKPYDSEAIIARLAAIVAPVGEAA